jgi:hypothetical protein
MMRECYWPKKESSMVRPAELRLFCCILTSALLYGLLFPPPLHAQSAPTSAAGLNPAYTPITGKKRVKWAVVSTIGPQSLAAGVLSAGWGTAFNSPEEYGTHWDGFAKRYGMRLTGVSTGNAIEASVGSIWGEDPRYFPSQVRTFWGRVYHAGNLTFKTRRADGNLHLAYARYVGNVGNNFLSNTWRVESESSVQAAIDRIIVGFAGKFGSNLFEEFWPSVRRKIKGGP